MTPHVFGLLELGSNSLKFYRVTRGEPEGYGIETEKIGWRVAHEFFARGSFNGAATAEVLRGFREVEALAPDLPLAGMLCLATGVFREIGDIEPVASRVRAEFGTRLRVISGRDEAKLMARCFETRIPGSVVLADLGGATTEWAWLTDGQRRDAGSLRLGAIRNHCAVDHLVGDPERWLAESRALCDEELDSLPITGPCELLFTGGTAKALARIRGTKVVSLDAVRAILPDVLASGGPEYLKPARREVLASGLVVLERFMVRCQAPFLRYSRTSVREGMATRLTHLLSNRRPRDLHATLLLLTSGGN